MSTVPSVATSKRPAEITDDVVSPWEWPTGAKVKYLGPEPSIEIPYRTDDGVTLYRTVEKGGTIDVSPMLAASLANRDDFQEA